jgi:hypothetical protein
VTLRCTGSPTSTFGGGGGTKLFCSQALSVTNADMAKAMRETVAALCLTAPFSSVHERAGSIPVPHSILLQRKLSVQRFSVMRE